MTTHTECLGLDPTTDKYDLQDVPHQMFRVAFRNFELAQLVSLRRNGVSRLSAQLVYIKPVSSDNLFLLLTF